MLVPRLLEHRLGAHHPAARPQQQLQHRELLARELHVAPVAVHLAPERIEPQVRELEHRRRGRRRAPGQRTQPYEQLGERERLGQVVVGPEREPIELVLVGQSGGGEHEDADLGVLAGDGRGHLVPVRAGQVPVEHEHVVGVDGEPVQRRVAVERDVGRDRLAAEAGLQRLREVELVLGDQHAHPSQGRRGDVAKTSANPQTRAQRGPRLAGGMRYLCLILIAACVAAVLPGGDATSLDPALQRAVDEATADAALDGITLEITSGVRTREYQQQLLDEAIETYGSERIARRYVNTPDRSTHVTGKAVDIGPTDAAYWLARHGARYGLCRDLRERDLALRTRDRARWHVSPAVAGREPSVVGTRPFVAPQPPSVDSPRKRIRARTVPT